MKHPIRAAIMAATAAFALSGCATNDYGYGGTSVSLGYGAGHYGDPYWGWYDDFYYPGTGYYIYDRGGARHRWSDNHRRYWEGRRGNRPGRENWSGYRDRANAPSWRGREGWQGRAPRNDADRQSRQQRREAWQARRQSQGTEAQRQSRQQRREAWQAQRQQSGQAVQPRVPRQDGTPSWRGRSGRDGR